MVEGYLAHKWGLSSSLPNFHPLKFSHHARKQGHHQCHHGDATAGSSFSYSILTNATNPAFEAANLPPGLTCNLGTGVFVPLVALRSHLGGSSASSNEYATSRQRLAFPCPLPSSVETPVTLS